MDIYTVRDNLIRTIEGKQALLEQYQKARRDANLPMANDAAMFATIQFLKENIAELRAILKDLEQCVGGYVDAYDQGWNDALVKERGGYE